MNKHRSALRDYARSRPVRFQPTPPPQELKAPVMVWRYGAWMTKNQSDILDEILSAYRSDLSGGAHEHVH